MSQDKTPRRIPQPTFFAFSNRETQDFFHWLTRNNGNFDVGKEIRDAFDRIERDPDLATDLEIFDCPSDTLRQSLAARLDDVIANIENDEVCGYGGFDYDQFNGELDSLCASLLLRAVRQINTREAAEAILRLHKKWNPDVIFPEIFRLPEDPDSPKPTG